MIKAIFFELTNVLVDLELVHKQTWNQVFQKIDSSYRISSSLMKQLVQLNNSVAKAFFWEKFRKQTSSTKISNFSSQKMLEFFNAKFQVNLDNNLSDDLINTELITCFLNDKVIEDCKLFIINNSVLSNFLYDKWNFKKRYSRFELCLPEKNTKVDDDKITFIEDEIGINLKENNIVNDMVVSHDCCSSDVIFVLHNESLIKAAKQAGAFVVGINVNNFESMANFATDLSNSSEILDKILYHFHGRE